MKSHKIILEKNPYVSGYENWSDARCSSASLSDASEFDLKDGTVLIDFPPTPNGLLKG